MSSPDLTPIQLICRFLSVILGLAVVGVAVYFIATWEQPAGNKKPIADRQPEPETSDPRFYQVGKITLWWDNVPDRVLRDSVHFPDESNIRLDDYVGPDACRKCHATEHKAWTGHPHRRMNAKATSLTILGDFSGDASISYRQGVARFYSNDDAYFMELKRDSIRREYQIAQTIGSRFQQYYVGRLLSGPEPPTHPAYTVNHVLPFGYWLSRRMWVPTVHIGSVRIGDADDSDEDQLPDDQRPDPFSGNAVNIVPYAKGCSSCHTTQPFGDLVLRNISTVAKHAPRTLDFWLRQYLQEVDATSAIGKRLAEARSFPELTNGIRNLEAEEHAVTLGVSCEACHFGSKAHAEGKLRKPKFFPVSPHVYIKSRADEVKPDFGRTPHNLNWTCARCHAGTRPTFAAGMSTWNSTEFTDAMKGSCYSRLTCVKCHNPHSAIGQKWSATPAHDDTSCLDCHQNLQATKPRESHTHHPVGSAGSRCMSCHMPRINEGMEDVVRTHMIFSPTRKEMIEANQPNACNLCHTDKPIDWTLLHLNDWYGAEFSQEKIARTYPNRDLPVAQGWLQSDFHSVRLVAADALTRTNSQWAIESILKALDDPFLLNRQFAQTGLERMLDIDLSKLGYRHYMTPDERRDPIDRIRNSVSETIRSKREEAAEQK